MVRRYMEGLQSVIGALPVEEIGEVIRVLLEAKMRRRQVFIMGNGGSATTASHFATDLIRNTHQFRVMSLTDSVSSMTATANDQSYNDIFLFPLVSLCSPKDVVIAISASGKSKNVLRAVEFANQVAAKSVGLTGFDGGNLGKISQIHVHVPSDTIEYVEDAHLAICHAIAKELREL